MRAFIGLSLSGVAAVGMTYLARKSIPVSLAFSMGLYQRQLNWRHERTLNFSGVFTDFSTGELLWRHRGCFRAGLGVDVFWKILPESRHFRPTSLRPRRCLSTFVCTGATGDYRYCSAELWLMGCRSSRCLITSAIG